MLYDFKLTPLQVASLFDWVVEDVDMADILIAKRDDGAIDVEQGGDRATIEPDGQLTDH